METIKIQNDNVVKAKEEDVEAGVEAVKAALSHLSFDLVNIVLMAALVQNCEGKAKLVPEFEQAREKFGQEPTWGGGEMSARCGAYDVEVTIRHSSSGAFKELLAAAMAEGKNPLELLQTLLGEDDGEPCNCPLCLAERGESEETKPDTKH